MPFEISKAKIKKTTKNSPKNTKKSNELPRASFMMTPEREKKFKKVKTEFKINTNVGVIDKALDEMLTHPENFRSSSIHRSTNNNLKEQLAELKELLPQESETIVQQGEDIAEIKSDLHELKESLYFLAKLIAEINPNAKKMFEEKNKSQQFFKEEF